MLGRGGHAAHSDQVPARRSLRQLSRPPVPGWAAVGHRAASGPSLTAATTPWQGALPTLVPTKGLAMTSEHGKARESAALSGLRDVAGQLQAHGGGGPELRAPRRQCLPKASWTPAHSAPGATAAVSWWARRRSAATG